MRSRQREVRAAVRPPVLSRAREHPGSRLKQEGPDRAREADHLLPLEARVRRMDPVLPPARTAAETGQETGPILRTQEILHPHRERQEAVLQSADRRLLQ